MFSKRSCWSVSAATKKDYIAAICFVVLVSRELIPLGNRDRFFRFIFCLKENFQNIVEDELYMLIHHFMSSSGLSSMKSVKIESSVLSLVCHSFYVLKYFKVKIFVCLNVDIS